MKKKFNHPCDRCKLVCSDKLGDQDVDVYLCIDSLYVGRKQFLMRHGNLIDDMTPVSEPMIRQMNLPAEHPLAKALKNTYD